ncbi:MAG: pilus assembly protein N-terminal domain-containing protein, partial [Candidatus Omnitrophica bacterium]|nr:pilus assembly protein N-terminal domain-containing protein [Candidatus Omnitrophota bacterium]
GIPAYAYTLIPEYLCEMGLELYKQGYINDALREFDKALIVNLNYAPALRYKRMIQERLAGKEEVPALEPFRAPVNPEVEAVAQPAVVQPPARPLPKKLPLPESIPQPKPVMMPAPLPKKQPEVMPKPVLPEIITPAAISKREIAIEKATEKKEEVITAPRLEEREKEIDKIMGELKETAPVMMPAPLPKKQPEVMPKPVLPANEEIRDLLAPQALILDESTRALTTALEIEQGRTIIIAGHNIQRFLLTQSEVLSVEKQSSDELRVTARDFGYTYLHVWDDNGRWTLEFLTVPVKPKGPTYEDILRRSEERANTFKLRYTLDWNSFYASSDGKFRDIKRSSYSFGHYLYLTGPTPYGDIDSNLSIRTLKTSTDLTYFTLGLTKGKIGPFEDFSLRAVDFSPTINNLAMSSPTLRGVMLESPAFHKTLDYTVFWGREGGGRFGGLSPGLAETRNSFLSGISADYIYHENQRFGFSAFSGWGKDRPTTLNHYGYDSYADFKLGKWDTRYELGYDSEKLAHLFTTKYELSKFKVTEEVRNIDKRFVTMTGTGWRVGELGSLTSLYYAPLENLDIDGRLDIFRDRLFPNPNDPERWNFDFRTDLTWRLDPLTSIRSDYSFLDDEGRISPFRSLNTGLGLYKTFEWPRRISTYVNYRH